MRLLRARFTATPTQRPNVEPPPRELLASVARWPYVESITRTDVPVNRATSKMLSPAARRRHEGVPEVVDPARRDAGGIERGAPVPTAIVNGTSVRCGCSFGPAGFAG